MTEIGIVADDVTGGTTVGALFARIGCAPTLFYDYKRVASNADPHDRAIIVSSNSRTSSPEEAFSRVREATQSLKDLGVHQFSKRIDTTLRGNIGAEIQGMLSVLSADHVALVVPSMPQSKKILVGGYSLIDSSLLDDTAVAHDVRTPVTGSHVPTLLQAQFDERVEHVSLATIRDGARAIRAKIESLIEDDCRVIVLDAVTLGQIDDIAEAAVALPQNVVAVDPGPFTLSLAIRRGSVSKCAHLDQAVRETCRPDDVGTVMVIAGSATSVTYHQMTRLLKEPGTVALLADPLKLISNDSSIVESEMSKVVDQALEIFSGTRPRVAILAVSSAVTGDLACTHEELESASGVSANEASNLLTERLGTLARRVCDVVGRAQISGFYLTGGDTVVRVWESLGANGIKLTDYVIPQVDQSEVIGGPYGGVPVVCKGGMTGTEVTAVQAINRLFDVNRMNKAMEMETTV